MYLKIKINQLVLTLNWLFILFPLSFAAGSFIVNAHFLTFICLGCVYLKKKNIKFRFDTLLFIFFLFCTSIIISSIDNQFNLGKAFQYLRFLIFYFICFYLLKEKVFSLDKVFNYYALFVSIIIIDLLIQHFFGYNIIGLKIYNFAEDKIPVATSFFQKEKVAGSFIQNFGIYLVFLVFYKFKKFNISHILIKSFVVSLISFSIFISFQRMPMVIWIFFLTIYGIIYYKSKLLPILFSFVILIFLIINFSSKDIITSYNSFFDNIKRMEATVLRNYNIIQNEKKYNEIKINPEKISKFELGSGHASLYANAIYIWKNNVLFGVGYKNFYNNCVEKKLTRCTTHPHNYYLDIIVTTGLFGFLIFLSFIVIVLSKIFKSLKFNLKSKNKKKNDIILFSLINFLMYFFPLKSSGSFFTSLNSTYMMIILVILLSQLHIENHKKNKI